MTPWRAALVSLALSWLAGGCDEASSSPSADADGGGTDGDTGSGSDEADDDGESPALVGGTHELYAGVVIDLGYQYDVLSGDWVYEYRYLLLLADGTVYYGLPRMHLGDFDVEASREADPDDWGEWTLADDGALRTRAAGYDWVSHVDWFPLTAPKSGETLDGTYSNLNTYSESSSDHTFFATGWSVVTFTPDGRFEESSGGSVTTDDGTVLDSESTAGTYEIHGLEMSLRFDDGHTVENTLLMSSAEQNILFINGVEFIVD